jgi:hypothetical protein
VKATPIAPTGTFTPPPPPPREPFVPDVLADALAEVGATYAQVVTDPLSPERTALRGLVFAALARRGLSHRKAGAMLGLTGAAVGMRLVRERRATA